MYRYGTSSKQVAFRADLKYGRGVEVYADSNEQLMLYALGALEKFEPFGPFKFARLVPAEKFAEGFIKGLQK